MTSGEAYPVVRSLLAAVLLATVLTWRLRPGAAGQHRVVPVRWRARLRPALMHAAALALAIGFYATDTLAWSANRVANELLQNGYSSFFRAALTNDIDYGAYYATRPAADNLGTLRAYLGRVAAASRASTKAVSIAPSTRAPAALDG